MGRYKQGLSDIEAATAGGSTEVFDTGAFQSLMNTTHARRVLFAAISAFISLSVLPIHTAGLWLGAVCIWHIVGFRTLDRLTVWFRNRAAAEIVTGLVGSAIFNTLPVLCFATVSPLGAVVAITWLGGVFMNLFVYLSGNRRILWAWLTPPILVAVFGPMLAHGFGLYSTVITTVILTSLIISRRFALDHSAVVNQLAERQITLVDLERKLSLAIDASGDGLFEIDLIASQWRVSPAWAAMLGYGPGEIETPLRDWRAFVHPDELPKLRDDFAAHLRDETPNTASEMRLRCKDGTYKWVLARARLVASTPDGKPAWMVGTTVDISERKTLERHLEAARDLAESASLAKSTFVATMSHEIRTPLNGVLGMVQAMAADSMPEGQRARLDVIRRSGESLLAILNDVLDFSKIESGKLELESVDFDLHEVVDGVQGTFEALAGRKGLALEVDLGDARGVYRGDPTRVRQVLYNLVSNAVKFTDTGGVYVGLRHGSQGLEIRVRDTGIGIPPEHMDSLFRKFEQADASTTRRFGGTGLGLAICHELVVLMGGSIDVESRRGEGAVFTATLPLERVDDERALEVRPEAAAQIPSRTLRVLAAEDNEINRLVLKALLAQVGVEPVTVENGALAVEAWGSGDWDVILMDMQMPVMDGLAATKAIRDQEAASGRLRTPIIALTANAMSHQVAEYLAAGMDGHVAKPIDARALFETLEQVLDAEPAAPETQPAPTRTGTSG